MSSAPRTATPCAASHVGVALNVPLDRIYTYSIAAPLRGALRVGDAVRVPFGRRWMVGIVVALDPSPPEGVALRDVAARLHDEPVLDEPLLRLLGWVAQYYRHPFGQVLATALPPLAQRRGGGDGEGALAAVAPATEEVVRLRGSATAALSAFARPGAVRDRLIAYLDRFGEVEVRQLVEQFSGARRVLRQLEQRDQLERSRRPRAAERAFADPAAAAAGDDVAPEPTADQAAALVVLEEGLRGGGFCPVLLHGVTGSGKTEVYLRAAQRALAGGGGVLVLVPEIALTPQLVQRFAARLQVPLAVLHSAMTPAQRLERWMGLRRGDARVAIGARSAVFAPVRDLRLVVVDEEHDGSYKQEDGLRYHARDVAVKRASLLGATCVLGSATPSLESLLNADRERYRGVSLPSRVRQRPMPEVQVVDLREERGGPEDCQRLLTPTLVGALRETVERGEQAILLLNRRGLSTLVVCGECGGRFSCPDCDTAMTYHGRRGLLTCHHCSRTWPLPDRCPNCNAAKLELLGEGTERVEEGLAELLPGVRVDRMDRDTTGARGAHERLLRRFREGAVEVLVGTQMVAKGHDFPRVTLVGVLHADAALHLPDFRSGERTFALLTQVAGRAGRGDRPGRVVVQTFVPHHDAIRYALAHDFEGYARKLLRAREALRYPPYGRMALLRLSHADEGVVRREAGRLGDVLRQAVWQREGVAGLRLLGPSRAPLRRIAGRYRHQAVLLAPDPRSLAAILDDAGAAVARARRVSGLRLAVDVDPHSML